MYTLHSHLQPDRRRQLSQDDDEDWGAFEESEAEVEQDRMSVQRGLTERREAQETTSQKGDGKEIVRKQQIRGNACIYIPFSGLLSF